MDTERVIEIAFAAVTVGFVAFSAYLILLGRRAGWFGIVAGILAALLPVVIVLVETHVVAAIIPDPMASAAPTFRDILMAILSRLLPILVFFLLPVVWLFWAYRRYKEARQDELSFVIATAVEAGVPLAPALMAYLHDRPREGRAVWDAALLVLFPPGYLVWTQRRTFDDRVARLSSVLATGAPLPVALRAVPGAAPREVRVAAAVGDATGRLAECLRRADRDRLTAVWIETLPRVLYPLLLLAFLGVVVVFLSSTIGSRFTAAVGGLRDADGAPVPLPAETARFMDVSENMDEYFSILGLVVLTMTAVVTVVAMSPTIRWYLSGAAAWVGRWLFGWMPETVRRRLSEYFGAAAVFRWEAQALVLRMLGALFAVGRPAPEALGLLESAPDIPAVVRRRIEKAQKSVRRGEPLAGALGNAGLLPTGMIPLVAVSERTRTLPNTLSELGDLLAGRAVRVIRRVSMVVAPILVVAIGLLVCYLALAVFKPLIEVLTRLSA
jgi:type II secretory pathway component PulF